MILAKNQRGTAYLRCSNKNCKKMKYLTESYSKLFASRGGLSDFIIYDADVQLRNQLNEKYNDEVKRAWNIMKDYI